MRAIAAHCHLGLGKLCRRAGKREQAHEHLAKATAMYREMHMRFWLEQAEVEVRELSKSRYEGGDPWRGERECGSQA